VRERRTRSAAAALDWALYALTSLIVQARI
jgi:hypothetical protein